MRANIAADRACGDSVGTAQGDKKVRIFRAVTLFMFKRIKGPTIFAGLTAVTHIAGHPAKNFFYGFR